MKADAASTFPFLIWIVEDELTSYLILYEIHLSAYHCHDRLTVYDHLQTLGLDNLVESFYLLLPDVVHVVCQTITSLFTERYLHSD